MTTKSTTQLPSEPVAPATLAQLLKKLRDAKGPIYAEAGVLHFEDGSAVHLQSVAITPYSVAVRKANALDHLMEELSDAGFDVDEPINGGDCVELVDGLYQELVKKFPR